MKKQIAVLVGGFTGEDVISHRSGNMVMANIDRSRFEPTKVIWDNRGCRAEVNGSEVRVDLNDFSVHANQIDIRFDLVFVMVHGDPGENGKIQGYLDLVGIPYTTGGVLPMALTASKFFTTSFLRQAGFRCAESILLRTGDALDSHAIAQRLGLPLFVKPNNGGSSLATSRCESAEEIGPAVDKALTMDGEVIIESFLKGTEVTSGVITRDGRPLALPLTEITTDNKFFDFNAKYEGASKEITPARIDEQTTADIQRISENIYRLLDCRGMIRVDYIITDKGPNVVEVNTVPGFSEASIIPQQANAIGISKTELISIVINGVLSGRH
jgi:D-alanine-D-alanine ligase